MQHVAVLIEQIAKRPLVFQKLSQSVELRVVGIVRRRFDMVAKFKLDFFRKPVVAPGSEDVSVADGGTQPIECEFLDGRLVKDLIEQKADGSVAGNDRRAIGKNAVVARIAS